MRTFEQLSQDEQMVAVESAVNDLIMMVVEECTPNCFLNYLDEIDEIFDRTDLHPVQVDSALRQKIESNQSMKVSVLHQAGALAKSAFYADTNDVVIRLG